MNCLDMASISEAVDAEIRPYEVAAAEVALRQLDLTAFFAGMQARHIPRLADYDVVLINSSAGKDSQAMLAWLVWLAGQQGYPLHKLLVVHADLGRVEWPGARELAEQQAHAYGLPFVAVARDEDLLDQVVTRHERLRARGDTTTPAWPSSQARYCTSDHKTSQVVKLITHLADEHRADGGGRIRILNCLGMRAGESTARAGKTPFGPDPANWSVTPRAARPATKTRPAVEAREGVPNSRRLVDRWLPIFDWSTEQVWLAIYLSGLPYHWAYDIPGVTRLSCVLCVLAPKRQLVAGARANPSLAHAYLAVEDKVGHTFKKDLSMRQICAEADAAGL